MSAIVIDGKIRSALILDELKNRVSALAEHGVQPGLAVILVGEDPASKVYVRNKEKACEKVGIRSFPVLMSVDTTQEQLELVIDRLNADPLVHGILVQLPLPRGLDEERALKRIQPEKDVDGFHVVNSGLLFRGGNGVLPCTPRGIIDLLHFSGTSLAGKEAVVIGRSNLVGKPVAMLLLNENCTVTVCHSRTKDLAFHTKTADILVSAVGKAGFVTADMVKQGAVVIDVGINRTENGIVGDVASDVWDVASAITPVPGGVGKMTVAMLMSNTVEAAERMLQ